MDKNEYRLQRENSKIWKEIRMMVKNDSCYNCNRKVNSFCSSHSLPAFILKGIADNGIILTANNWMNFVNLEVDKGVKSSGVFYIICSNCDSKIFSSYEKSENYNIPINQNMLAQISMKNYLFRIHNKTLELGLAEKLIKEESIEIEEWIKFPKGILPLFTNLDNDRLDLEHYKTSFQRTKNNIDKKDKKFLVIFEQILPYITPIAIQDCLTLIVDFEENIINDVQNKDGRYLMKDIQISVFTLKEKTYVNLFIERVNLGRYKSFIDQFNKLDNNERLSVISFLILSYCEHFFISPKINKELLTSKFLISTAKIGTHSGMLYYSEEHFWKIKKESHSLKKAFKTPNLLSFLNRIQ